MNHWTAKEGEPAAPAEDVRINKALDAPVDIEAEVMDNLNDKSNVRSEARTAPEQEAVDDDMGGTLVVLEDELVDGPDGAMDMNLGSPV